eukprot:scaffold14576_cov132-Isochrysis_galbana.AAC.14
MEPQLLDFYAEDKENDEHFPVNSIEAARLRLALRDARAERVGEERVYAALLFTGTGRGDTGVKLPNPRVNVAASAAWFRGPTELGF